MDSFLAARKVGRSGRVIGIDMTEAQLAKANALTGRGGFQNVDFRHAHIEALPVADASADVVISNGVINLSADKATVFAEIARVLRPGGRLAIADIVTSIQLPEAVTCDASLWAACIGGAMQRDDYRQAIERAGLAVETMRENEQYRFVSDRADNATQKYGVKSISLLARKTNIASPHSTAEAVGPMSCCTGKDCDGSLRRACRASRPAATAGRSRRQQNAASDRLSVGGCDLLLRRRSEGGRGSYVEGPAGGAVRDWVASCR